MDGYPHKQLISTNGAIF